MPSSYYANPSWAQSTSLWAVVAIASLSTFLFALLYLYILSPSPGATYDGLGLKLSSGSVMSADGDIDHDSRSSTATLHSDLQRFFARVVGGSSNQDKSTNLRPFRSLGFLLLTLPTSYRLYRESQNEQVRQST